MKNKTIMKTINLIIALAFLFVLSTFSCTKESANPSEGTIPSAHVLTSNELNCASYTEFDFLESDEDINQLFAQADKLFYTNFDSDLKVFDSNSGTTSLLASDIFVQEIEVGENQLFFCTTKGIYQVNPNDLNSFSLYSPYGCTSLEIATEGQVYFIGFDLALTNAAIYTLDNDGEAIIATRPVEESLSTFEVLENGQFFCFNAGNTNTLYRFASDGTLLNIYDPTNSPLREDGFESNVWTFVEGNRLLGLLKNGARYPVLFEWVPATEELHNYIDPELLEAEGSRDKLRDLITPSYMGITLKDNEVFIPTTLASCRGIIRIKIEPITTVNLVDIDILQDENLTIGYCLQGLQFAETETWIYSQKKVMQLSGCQ